MRASIRRLLVRGSTTMLASVVLAACGSVTEEAPPSTAPPATNSQTPTITATADGPPIPPDSLSLALDGRASDLLRPVSKQHALGDAYEPPDLVTLPASLVVPGYPERRLRAEAADALGAMIAAAGRDGLQLRVVSAYRSYEEQEVVHRRHVERRGEAEASRRSAPPGHSEHQLGTTVDLSALSLQWRLSRQLAEAPEGRWLAAHAHEYGFALSYPEDAEAITGYVHEPWHLRYVGVDHAATWRASGLTLIEYLEGLAGR